MKLVGMRIGVRWQNEKNITAGCRFDFGAQLFRYGETDIAITNRAVRPDGSAFT